MVVLKLATRAEVESSPMADRIREAVGSVAGGVGRFAKDSTPEHKRCVTLDSPSPRAAIWEAVGNGWAYVSGFLVSRQGHVFHTGE